MESMDLSPIPEFLSEYLLYDPYNRLSELDLIYYTFTFAPGKELSKEDFVRHHQYFVEWYKIAKEELDIRLHPWANPDVGPISYPLEREADIFELPDRIRGLVDIKASFDIPAYWYDPSLKQLKRSLLPGGIRLSYTDNTNWVISLMLEFCWFTRHVVCRKFNAPQEGESLYFEPAAKLNREMFRNLAKRLESAFPEFEVNFYSEYETIPPVDRYGFPDQAEDFYLVYKDDEL